MVTLSHWLILSGMLFVIGTAGVFINRRHTLVLLMSLELMLLAVSTNFLAIGYYLEDLSGQVFTLFILTVAAAEIAIGLAIVTVVFRSRGTLRLDELRDVRG